MPIRIPSWVDRPRRGKGLLKQEDHEIHQHERVYGFTPRSLLTRKATVAVWSTVSVVFLWGLGAGLAWLLGP